MKQREKNNKKHFEFSKIITIFIVIVLMAIAVWSIIEYYKLTELAIKTNSGILPDVNVATTCITTILGALLSYCLYQFGLKNSRNKFGVNESGQPYKEKIEFIEEEPAEDYIKLD